MTANPIVRECSVEFTTPWFDVIAKRVLGLPGCEEEKTYFAVVPPDYVSVVAVTTGNEIVLVRRYRPVVEQYTLELPSGHVEDGQTPEDAARRELWTRRVAREPLRSGIDSTCSMKPVS
jgi:ADP-ribose pyrophosphatase